MAEGAASNLENEIAQIEQQLADKRAVLESQTKHDKELLHEVVREKIDEAVVSVPTDDASSTPAASSPVTSPSDDFSTLPLAAQATVQQLVIVAFTKSIGEAIKQARATNNAALIDAFHDLLVDQLYDQLVQRGKLRPV